MVSNPNSSISREELLDLVYPVGSVYISFNNTSPEDFLGGTWTQLQDRFLLAASDTYPAGFSGGEATHTLTEDEMPAHIHDRIVTNNNTSGLTRGMGTYSQTSSGKNGYGPWFGTGFSYQGTAQTNETGGGQPHNNLPPYVGVYMWRRTA